MPAFLVLGLAAVAFLFFGGLNKHRPSGIISASYKLEVKGRKAARNRARAGIKLLLDDRHHEALSHLNRAVRADNNFAEAYLARSVAHLGVGKTTDALQDAETAIKMLRDHQLDELAWKKIGREAVPLAIIVANRVQCVASEIGRPPLTPDQGVLLVRLLREFSVATDCDQAQNTLERWENEGRIFSILDRARASCPHVWPCGPTS